VLGKMELTRALRGHISARIPGHNRFFVRARGPGGKRVRYTTEDEIVEIDLDGKPVAGMPKGLRTPSEVYIHTEILRARPDVNAGAAFAPTDDCLVHRTPARHCCRFMAPMIRKA
jgi:ribulose-5-phosphate 4-epimerase/fuculose-1-phosphate aldolase